MVTGLRPVGRIGVLIALDMVLPDRNHPGTPCFRMVVDDNIITRQVVVEPGLAASS
jgi:hypothetical protein